MPRPQAGVPTAHPQEPGAGLPYLRGVLADPRGSPQETAKLGVFPGGRRRPGLPTRGWGGCCKGGSGLPRQPPRPDALTPRPADTCAQTGAAGRNCAPEIRCAWILVSPLSFPLVSQLYRKTPAGFRGATGLSDSGRVRRGALTGNKHRLSVSAKVIRKTSEEGQGTFSPHCETPPFLRDTSPCPQLHPPP